MSTENDKLLAEALNDLSDANLHVLEHDISCFVQDYFVQDNADCSDSDSSADDGDEDDISSSLQTSSDEEDEFHDIPVPVVADLQFEQEDRANEENSEEEKAASFRCKCKLFNGSPCSQRYCGADLLDSRCEMSELSKGIYCKLLAYPLT